MFITADYLMCIVYIKLSKVKCVCKVPLCSWQWEDKASHLGASPGTMGYNSSHEVQDMSRTEALSTQLDALQTQFYGLQVENRRLYTGREPSAS